MNKQHLIMSLAKSNFSVALFPSCTEDLPCLLSLESSVGHGHPLPSRQSWHFRYQVAFAALPLLQASNAGSRVLPHPFCNERWCSTLAQTRQKCQAKDTEKLRVAAAGNRWDSPPKRVGEPGGLVQLSLLQDLPPSQLCCFLYWETLPNLLLFL